MIYFFDTSALIKNYIDETGSDMVASLFSNADELYISEISIIECISTIRRLLIEKLISKNEYKQLKREIKNDFQFFKKIAVNEIYENAEQLIDSYQLKSLDSIQLGSAIYINEIIDKFICCDQKLLDSAKKENLDILNPAITK